MARIQQLEYERDELRKDIEQLCMQQAGPSYLVVATRMHFQRTAGLEQEIENLKKKLSACTRENMNLQEELSEAYRIKSQLADLHAAEVTKNMEAEKQVKFFQGCVAAAFAERDHAVMEAEKAKEKEELMPLKFNEFQKRIGELTSDCLEKKKLNATLRIELAKQEALNETFKEVVDKFYGIRQQSLEGIEDTSWDDKCVCLLRDSEEMWSFSDTSTSKYIVRLYFLSLKQSALEDELEKTRSSLENLRSKLHVGLEIENHLKKTVRELEKKIIRYDKLVIKVIKELRHCHSQHRAHISNLLNEERSHIKSIIDVIEEKNQQFNGGRKQSTGTCHRDEKLDEFECRDVHISTDANTSLLSKMSGPGLLSDIIAERKGDTSNVLAQALQEKVAALLLLSQQEERHLLERNVNAALQNKIDELQRNLLQVTNEKVKALMELAQLKQEYQSLQEYDLLLTVSYCLAFPENGGNQQSKLRRSNLSCHGNAFQVTHLLRKITDEMKQGKAWAEIGGKRVVATERDGRLKNLLKKTNLRRWIGPLDFSGSGTQAHLNNEGVTSMDFARMKVEIATLKESMESMEHLTSSIHRLRLSLSKVKESVSLEDTVTSMTEALDDIMTEAKLVKTALGSSLPISWSALDDDGSSSGSMGKPGDICGDYGNEKIDSVSAAGFEMVELLILAAQILKDSTTQRGS
ncbi:hypothetical protein JRO89_XS02G0103800 [Xanthoceras sorbifolium]|uniref:Myosin heavy chain-related protein n=1 Tax=Xanthoceras sorbifolium TaxID=99658 RepID=A0ABQ8IGT3_9ROSI|nr:hypothetical protein JRO89_XS02G0103800 [Xanthoceras sorbifolium]